MVQPEEARLLRGVNEVTQQVAKIVSAYWRELVDGGMPKEEAFELSLRLEERILGPIYDEAERKLSGEGPPCPLCHSSDDVSTTEIGSDHSVHLCTRCPHLWGSDG